MKTILFLFSLTCSFLSAASSFYASSSRAYSGNAGWLSFAGSYGVTITDTFFAGYAYAANFGWIHMGDGTPINGWSYQNASSSDYGVNIDSSGRLTGYAYSANIGWINFEQTHGKPLLNYQTGKLTGNIYSANIGWIALDTTFTDLVAYMIHRQDSDGDGMEDSFEYRYFTNLTTANATTDADGDCATDVAEYIAGTNPLDAMSHLRMISHLYTFLPATNQVKADLDFTSVSNRLYKIEYSSSMQPGTWMNSAYGSFPGASDISTSTKLFLPHSNRYFFRVEALLPLPYVDF